MVLENTELEISADSAPFVEYLAQLKLRLESINRSLSLDDLGFELVRFEQNIDAADAGKITISLYPSDAFLRYVAAIVAGDGNLEGVQ